MTESARAPRSEPKQAELRAARLAEEEGLRPSRLLAVTAAGVWLALFALRALVLPDVALQIRHGVNLVPTLALDLPTITVCAIFLCALVTARAPGGRGILARDFVRLALGSGLWLAGATAVDLVAANVLGGAPAPGDDGETVMLVLLTISGVGTLVGGGGLALLWLGVAYEVAVLPRGALADEVPRVAHLAAPFVVAVLLWTTRYANLFGETPLVLLPPHAAVALTFSTVVVVLAAWRRLFRRAGNGGGPARVSDVCSEPPKSSILSQAAAGVWLLLFLAHGLLATRLADFSYSRGGGRWFRDPVPGDLFELAPIPTSLLCGVFVVALATAGPTRMARALGCSALGVGGLALAATALWSGSILAEVSDRPVRTAHAVQSFLGSGPIALLWALLLLVLALLWLGFAASLIPGPRGRVGGELRRAAHIAAPAATLLSIVVLFVVRQAPGAELTVVAPEHAVALSGSSVLFCLALWLRLRQPAEATS